MKIVVCVNPTTGAAVDDVDAALRAGSTPVSALRSVDTHAVEAALQIAEARPPGETEVVVVTVAPAEALGAVRDALAVGAHRGVLVDDAPIRELDLVALAAVLAALLASEPAELYLTCTSSTDIDGLLCWSAAGEHLRLPVLTGARRLELVDGEVTIERQSEGGDQVLTTALPCLVEVTETLNQARYPTMKGRAAAQNKPIRLLRPTDLDIDVESLGRGTTIESVRSADRSRDVVVLSDPETAPREIVAFLRQRSLW